MTMIIKEIRDQVEDLIKTNQISESAQLSYPNFCTQDIYPIMHSYFNQDAIMLFSKKTYGMVHQHTKYLSDSKFGQQAWLLFPLLHKLKLKFVKDLEPVSVNHYALVHCFGFHTTKDRVGEAALKIVNVINDLATNKHALATLAPLMYLELADKSCIVISYLAIDQQYESLVQSTYAHCLFKECALPPELK